MTAAIIIALLLVMGTIAWGLKQKYPRDEDPIVAAIDALLPQTQCAQCGFSGCRPYAEALARSEAATNLCPPGGNSLFEALNDLLQPDGFVESPTPADNLLAVIDEARCIGCALCLPPCPVDAIVGASGFMHTVIEAQCTGCELCVPACPVDCISMVVVPTRDPILPSAPATAELGCIACGRCDDSCPLSLPAQTLLSAIDNKQVPHAQELGLDRCIECGLCDKACPANIPLAHLFGIEKQTNQASERLVHAKEQLKARYAQHTARLASAAEAQNSRRAERLQKTRSWH